MEEQKGYVEIEICKKAKEEGLLHSLWVVSGKVQTMPTNLALLSWVDVGVIG